MPFSRRSARLLTAVLLAPVLCFALAFAFSERKSVSETENRPLAAFPEISPASLLDSNGGEAVEAYVSDHFPLRKTLLALRYRIERLFRGESNGVLFTSDGYLVKRCRVDAAGKANTANNLDALCRLMAAIRESGTETVFALAPRTVDVVSSSLSRAYISTHAADDEALQAYPVTDLAPILRERHNSGEAVMYKTDHHWTTRGAYYAYAALCPLLGVAPYPIEDFEEITVKTDFVGTTQALAGCLPRDLAAKDAITLYRYDGDEGYTVTIHDTGETQKGLYSMEYLDTKDAYRVFLGGNYGRVSVTIESDTPRSRLLLFKDSFALSLLPFLLRHFDVEMIDPRYDTSTSIASLLEESDFSRALILIGRDTCRESAAISRYCRRALSSDEIQHVGHADASSAAFLLSPRV